MLTTSQAAAVLGVSRPRVLKLIAIGTLVAIKPGRDWQIDSASVEVYRISERRPGRKKPTNVNKNEQSTTHPTNTDTSR